ncbi:FAS1 domain-containing protein precursor [Geosmithia morbida]|uniref:FAS1 domain-containing protein n=1 Tax=Geosmithia morbida TaxID=1094350 RepID=A0A9P4YYK7_9HYPO|nr:FAS1 domain-containing protein precursor [Geosmithia morbida]KAF4124887.1 FAS1 domain-containing protein precursor [Geosmithia morbida]
MPSSPPPPNHQPAVALSDILGTSRALTSFSSLVRLHESTSSLLSDMSTNTTILAPLNSAIDGMPHKPWVDPRDYAAAAAGGGGGGGGGGSDGHHNVDVYEGEGGRKRARDNLLRFVEAHLVPVSPWDGSKVRTYSSGGDGGRTVWCERRDDGKTYVMPDGVEVEKVASQVGNGEMWLLKGVLTSV